MSHTEGEKLKAAMQSFLQGQEITTEQLADLSGDVEQPARKGDWLRVMALDNEARTDPGLYCVKLMHCLAVAVPVMRVGIQASMPADHYADMLEHCKIAVKKGRDIFETNTHLTAAIHMLMNCPDDATIANIGALIIAAWELDRELGAEKAASGEEPFWGTPPDED